MCGPRSVPSMYVGGVGRLEHDDGALLASLFMAVLQGVVPFHFASADGTESVFHYPGILIQSSSTVLPQLHTCSKGTYDPERARDLCQELASAWRSSPAEGALVLQQLNKQDQDISYAGRGVEKRFSINVTLDIEDYGPYNEQWSYGTLLEAVTARDRYAEVQARRAARATTPVQGTPSSSSVPSSARRTDEVGEQVNSEDIEYVPS